VLELDEAPRERAEPVHQGPALRLMQVERGRRDGGRGQWCQAIAEQEAAGHQQQHAQAGDEQQRTRTQRAQPRVRQVPCRYDDECHGPLPRSRSPQMTL
jgi:hypothetical protein